MSELLLFNIVNPEKRTALRLLSMRLGIQCRDIPAELQGAEIGDLLAGIAVSPPAQGEPPFTEEMLLMNGLSSGDFHVLLDTLHQAGQTVRLKAVVTDNNRKWSAFRLYRELRAEDEAIQKWKQQAVKGNKHKKK